MLNPDTLFEHPAQHSSPARSSVLTLAHACALADLFEARGLDSPHSTMRDYSKWWRLDYRGKPFEECAPAWAGDPVLMQALEGAPDFWSIDVSTVLSKRSLARAQAARMEATRTFETTPAIRAYMLEHFDDRGARAPERCDMSWMIERAKRTANQFGRPREPWTPDASKCPLRLKLAEGVSFISTQEAYADHSTTIVPVEGPIPEGEMLAECRRRLSDFARRCDSHTGLAGSGTNWSADLIIRPEGAFALISGRHSICD